MFTQLTVQVLSLLRSLGGAILSSVGPAGVIAMLAGGLLLLQVPASFLRFLCRPRNLAMVAAVLIGGMGVMLSGSPPLVGQAAPGSAAEPARASGTTPTPAAKPAEPQSAAAEDSVQSDKLVSFEPPPAAEVKQPNATCGHCGTDFFASWNKKTRCPQCGFVMDAERAMREKSGPVGPDLTSDWFMKSLQQDEEIRKREAERRERDRLKREAEQARKGEIFRWERYFLDHIIVKKFDRNGFCVHCRNEFKTPNEGRTLFMPCPQCSKEAVTWRLVETPHWNTPVSSENALRKSMDRP